MKGYRAQGGGVVFDRRNAFVDRPVTVSCGQCAGCRRQRAKQWAIRNMHEAQCHEKIRSLRSLTTNKTYRQGNLYNQDTSNSSSNVSAKHFREVVLPKLYTNLRHSDTTIAENMEKTPEDRITTLCYSGKTSAKIDKSTRRTNADIPSGNQNG